MTDLCYGDEPLADPVGYLPPVANRMSRYDKEYFRREFLESLHRMLTKYASKPRYLYVDV